MTSDLVKQILGSTVFSTMILAMGGGIWKIVKDKRSNRRIDDRDANDRLSDFQAAAEDHILNYDVPMAEHVNRLTALVNQERMARGEKAVDFPALPKPVPLYTRRDRDKKATK